MKVKQIHPPIVANSGEIQVTAYRVDNQVSIATNADYQETHDDPHQLIDYAYLRELAGEIENDPDFFREKSNLPSENRYLVHWEMDIFSRSPRNAAMQARTIMLDPDSTATVFNINGENFDLEEEA